MRKARVFFKSEEKTPNVPSTPTNEVTGEAECPDGGYGWVICLAAAVIQFITLGIHNNFGILYTYLIKDLQVDPTEAAWIGSIAFGMMFLCGPIASSLCQRCGCRVVASVGGVFGLLGLLSASFTSNVYVIYLTYSVLWGFGSSLNYAPTMLVLGEYFDKHLPLANGIVTAGSGVGTMAMGPFYHFVLSNLGWKMMLRILCAFAFVMILSALLYRPLPARYKRAHSQHKERPKFFDPSVWKMKSFVFWVVSMSLLFVGYFVPFIHLPNHAENLGIPGHKASLLVGYLSISSTVARVIFGLVLDDPRINRFYVLQSCFLMMAVASTLCPLALDYTGLIIYAISFGAFDGCFVLLIAITTSDIVGCGKLPPALGNLYGVISIPMIFGPPLAALIFKISGSYQNAFFVAGGAMVCGTFTLSLIPLFMPHKKSPPVKTGRELLDKDDTSKEVLDENSDGEKPIIAVDTSFLFDTSNFAMRNSLSCLALNRLGDLCGSHYLVGNPDRETDV
ncbi:Monocarboxylate transporter 10 [Acropora cervicornis]|uniref:Monocarboxylate transporter 10 n=1 Tax=Acropora cervicornis TaxID=6130 RepID=A0AAD9VCC1_ACRCE|nr:Monocarboxylate transporter 10 [Acropora cervicornis]